MLPVGQQTSERSRIGRLVAACWSLTDAGHAGQIQGRVVTAFPVEARRSCICSTLTFCPQAQPRAAVNAR